MDAERSVKLVRDGEDQILLIPLGFELPGEDAIMWREGDRLVIQAAPHAEDEQAPGH